MSELNELEHLTDKLRIFRDERSWQQFHSLKELILSLNLEASELLELTQWKSAEELDQLLASGELSEHLEEECADVLSYLLLIADKAGFDLLAATHRKIEKNTRKYPVEKARGSAKKYTQL